jgi:Plasmid pRiA4b ORF-3-like protein
MTASTTDAIAALRIEIKYIEPLIWRRVAVRTSMNLEALHTVIQATMGWLDYHLWELAVDEHKYGIPDPDRPHVKNGAATQLATILASGMTEFDYVYDFGDNWEHRIVVERISTAETGAKYPRFLGGERRCPPEDCGGPPGYFDFIENIARKQSKGAKEALDWYGGPYDSDDIDVEQINISLGRITSLNRTIKTR